MATDTAALVVALSAQVSKFEKDMQQAVSIADKRTKEIETTFTRLNSTVVGRLQQIGGAAQSQLGFVGQLLGALGPAGITAAVGIGAVVGGIVVLVEQTEKFASKAQALKEVSDTTGLTITQIKLLGQAGSRVGLDFEETTGFFTKFLANLEALRDGGGPLFDVLLKIDSGLLRQLSTTRDSATAIDLLVRAYQRLDDQTQKLALARAAGGRAGLSGVRLLDNLGEQGGLSGLQANSPAIDEGQIDRAARLRKEIEALKKQTENVWGGMFSDSILEWQKQSATWLKQISDYVASIVGGVKTVQEGSGPSQRINVEVPAGGAVPLPQPRPAAAGQGSPAAELAILQRKIALLGEATTQGEQLKQKELEIAAAALKDGVATDIQNRALAAFNLTLRASALAARERLGIATEEEIAETRLAQLKQDATKYGLSKNQVDKASVIILREAKDAADALAVRQAYLPGLKQLELDATSTRKALDTLAVNSLTNVENALVDVITHTKSASEAFRAMANAIIADLARIAIRQAITGPLAGFLGGLFGNPLSATRAEGGPIGLAIGGLFRGKGGPRSDSNLVALSDGEYVINAEAAAQYRGLLDAINSGGIRGFADGGSVPAARGLRVASAAGAAINVTINNAPTFQAGMTPTDVAAIRAQMEQNNSMLRTQLVRDLRQGLRNDSQFLG